MASKDLTIRLLGDLSDLQKKLNQASNDLARVGATMTKKVTPAAAATSVAMTKLGNDWNDAADAIVVGTGASGEALDGLLDSAKRVAGRVPNDFGEVGQAIADVNTRLKVTGPDLESTAEAFLNLSRVTGTDVKTNIASVTRVFGDWSVQSQEQAATLDKLFAATQQTGIGIDRLSTLVVQFGAPMRQLGFSLDESIALFGKFEQEGVNIEAVMSGLRMGLGRMAKAGEEPIDTFQRLIEQIKNAGTQGEANAIALEGFGQRAGPDMAAAIREGRFELDDLVASLSGSGGALDDAADRTIHLSDRLQMLRNRITATLGPFGEIGGAAAGVVASIGPLLFGIGQMGPALSKLTGKLGGFKASMKLAGGAIGAAGLAFAAYELHAQRAAQHTQNVIDAADKLSRVADEALGQVFTNAVMEGMLAGKSLDETMSSLARTNLEGSKRMLDHAAATGVSNEATQALADAISNEEAQRRQQTETTAKYAETQQDAIDATDAATEATGRSSDAIELNDGLVSQVNKTYERQTKKLEEVAARTERFRQNVEKLGTEWDQFKGKLDDKQAFINIQRTFEQVGAKAQEAIDAGTEATLEQQEALIDLQTEVGNYLVEVGNVPPDVATKIVADIERDGVEEIQALIASWGNGVTLPIRPVVVGGGGSAPSGVRTIVDQNGNVRIGRLDGNAAGTSYWQGGRTLVGERGPEIVDLPSGSRIHTNQTSRRMAEGAPESSRTLNVNITGQLDQRAVADLYKMLKDWEAGML